MNDLTFALRQLIKAPAFSAIAVLTLALGLGASTLVFSWIRSVLIDTVPGARTPSRLVVPVTVIGIAPPGFRGTMGGLGLDLWVPLTMSNEHADLSRMLQNRTSRWLHTMARLREGVTLARAH